MGDQLERTGITTLLGPENIFPARSLVYRSTVEAFAAGRLRLERSNEHRNDSGGRMTTSRSADRIPPTFKTAAARGLTTPRAAGVAGIIFALLFFAALALLGEVVGVGLATETVMDNLNGPASDLGLIGLYLVPFAGIAFLWFIAVVRDRIGAHEDRFFATAFLGSGLLFVAMLFGAAAVLGGLIAGNSFGTAAPTDIATVGFARSVGYSFLFVYSAKVAGVFMLATSTIVQARRLVALDLTERLHRSQRCSS